MSALIDAFWRAAAYCLHPRIIVLSLVPLAVMVMLALGLGYFFWDPAVQWVFSWLESSALFSAIGDWLRGQGFGELRMAIAPLVVLVLATPVVIISVMLLVALMMMPAIVRRVAARRFPDLQRKHGGSFMRGLLWSLGSSLLAVVALLISLPLWLIPPLIVILPPVIWGWLTYRVMVFDALAEHASVEERRALLRRHRAALLAMGVVSGYLGAAPSLLWASGWLFAALFFFLIPVAIWIYTLVFAFSSLWFAHYCLAALEAMRVETAAMPPEVPPAGQVALQDAGPPHTP